MGETEASSPQVFSMESDISKLEAPTFTTIERNQQAAMLALDWDHQVNLVGKKVVNPMIHCCDQCLKPILVYGRMIPCKHVFCLACAKKEEKQCPRCKDKVSRVEPAGLGNIYLCTQGGTRYGNSGCRRTYLSTRDLQAHVLHRHSKGREDDSLPVKKEVSTNEAIRNAVNSLSKASLAAAVAAASSINSGGTGGGGSVSVVPSPYSTAAASGQYGAATASYSSAAATTATSTAAAAYSSGPPPTQYRPSPGGGGPQATNHISVINTRQSNLISIPIHGNGTPGSEPPPASAPPPPRHSGYAAPAPAAAYANAAVYPAYAPSGTGAAGPPPPVAVPATSYPGAAIAAPTAYNQPPPTYQYAGNYSSAPPPTPGQYAPAPSPSRYPTNYAPAYQQPPAGGPPFQGQFSRPPPANVVRGPPPPSSTNFYRR